MSYRSVKKQFKIFGSIGIVALYSLFLYGKGLERSLGVFKDRLKNLSLMLRSARIKDKGLSMEDMATGGMSIAPYITIEKQMLEYTNQYRAQNGLLPLQWSDDLAGVSREHSQSMALKIVGFGHEGFVQRISQLPFRYTGAAAENVFMMTTIRDIARIAVDSWIKSPGHRANLLGDYKYCGIGMYESPSRVYYVTQIFATFQIRNQR